MDNNKILIAIVIAALVLVGLPSIITAIKKYTVAILPDNGKLVFGRGEKDWPAEQKASFKKATVGATNLNDVNSDYINNVYVITIQQSNDGVYYVYKSGNMYGPNSFMPSTNKAEWVIWSKELLDAVVSAQKLILNP